MSHTMTTAHHLDQRQKTITAILLTCFSYGIFVIGDAVLKVLGAKFHFSEIVIINCSIIITCMALWTAMRDGKKGFVMLNRKLILFRAALSAAVGVCNILALPYIKLTTFYTLVFTSPLWVALLAMFFLKEKLEPRRLCVILTGFAAVLFVFHPGSDQFNVWTLLILTGAFFYSCSLVAMRKLGPRESRAMIIIMGSLVSMAFSAPFLPFHYVAPTTAEWGLFLIMGTVGAVGVAGIAYAFQNAPAASVVAPFHYTQMIWGALLGYFFFKEMPDDRVILGATCIIAAGLYLIFSETRRKPKVPEIPESGAVS